MKPRELRKRRLQDGEMPAEDAGRLSHTGTSVLFFTKKLMAQHKVPRNYRAQRQNLKEKCIPAIMNGR